MTETNPVVASDDAIVRAAWPFPRRLVAVFTSPRILFEHLEHRPTWLVPFLLMLASAVVYVLTTWDAAWVPMMTAQLEAQDAGEAAYQMVGSTGKLMYSFIIPIFGGVFTVIYAAIVMGSANFLLGGKMSFKQSLSVVCHAGMVGLLGLPIRILLANMAENPQVTLGPGAMLPLADQEGFAMKFLAGFLQSFDVFTLWQTVLVAIGVSVIARVGFKASLIVTFGLFVVFSLIGALGATFGS